MPNVTISVPDDLKAEMDKFLEVNWSEVGRKAIAKYIDERKNPTPRVEFDIRDARVGYYPWQSSSPTLTVSLRIHNHMESEIVVDRVLFHARCYEGSNQYGIGSGSDLYKRVIGANSSGEAYLILELTRERIEPLASVFKSTFQCQISCILFAEGFKNSYSQEVYTKIPIDEWKEAVSKVLPQSSLQRKSSKAGKGEARQSL
jgi:hypothetical protein